jgi:hypothetical protein
MSDNNLVCVAFSAFILFPLEECMPRGGDMSSRLTPGKKMGRPRKFPERMADLVSKLNAAAEKQLRLRLGRFAMTKEQFDELLAAQNYRCPICRELLSNGWVIDHNHLSLQVRGILHVRCNSPLGLANDDVQRLERAITYLRGSRVTVQTPGPSSPKT